MFKTNLTYKISTALFSVLILGGAGMYFFNTGEVAKSFTALGYPTYLIYPMATAKLLGLVAIWTRKSALLRDLAYAGFFFNLLLAALAHVMVGDGEAAPALVGLALLVTSNIAGRRA